MNECMNIQRGSLCDFGFQREMKSVASFSFDCFYTLTLIVPRLWMFKYIQHQEVSNY